MSKRHDAVEILGVRWCRVQSERGWQPLIIEMELCLNTLWKLNGRFEGET